MKELKIITSNIRFDNPADGIHDWTARKELLAGIYQAFDPDFLGTQEGRQGQTRELDGLLPKLTLVDGHRTWIDERMYPCLYVNPEKITVHRSGDIWLSETPDVPGSSSFQSAFPRLCTWIEITVKESGLKLMVVNTHLDHILQDTREKQIQVLINEIKKINSFPLFIMGDFNESPDTSVQKNLVQAFHLKDPWKEKNYPEETSHHGFKGHEALEGDRIDWILIPEAYECREIRLEKKSFNGIYPSDHYPMLATVIPK